MAGANRVLRAVFADRQETWSHVDPRDGEILGIDDAKGRRYRWLYNALHSLDFGILLRHRPAWDTVMWHLLIAGTCIALTGTALAWRRLSRRIGRIRPSYCLPSSFVAK